MAWAVSVASCLQECVVCDAAFTIVGDVQLEGPVPPHVDVPIAGATRDFKAARVDRELNSAFVQGSPRWQPVKSKVQEAIVANAGDVEVAEAPMVVFGASGEGTHVLALYVSITSPYIQMGPGHGNLSWEGRAF